MGHSYFVLRQVHQSEFKMAFIKVALFLALVAVTTAYTFKKTDQKPGDLNAYHCTANRLDKLHRAPDNTRIIFTGPKKVLKGSIKEKDCKDWCEKHLVQGFKCVAFSYQAYDRQGGARCTTSTHLQTLELKLMNLALIAKQNFVSGTISRTVNKLKEQGLKAEQLTVIEAYQ